MSCVNGNGNGAQVPYPPDEYASPAVRTGVVLTARAAPPAGAAPPETNSPMPTITFSRPVITPAMVHTNAEVEDWDRCGFTRWVADHPLLAGLGAVAVYLLIAGRKRRA